MKRRKIIFVGTLTDLVQYIDHDLSDELGIESAAFEVLESLEGKVSSNLWDMLFNLLLGFSAEMQLEMARNLADFFSNHTVHTTGCMSADAVLKSCYKWIAEEQGFDKEDIEESIF